MYSIKVNLSMEACVEHKLRELLEECRKAYNDSITVVKELDTAMRNDPDYASAKALTSAEYKEIVAARRAIKKDPQSPEITQKMRDDAQIKILTDLEVQYGLYNERYLNKVLADRVRPMHNHSLIPTAMFARTVTANVFRAYSDYVDNLNLLLWTLDKQGTDISSVNPKMIPILRYKPYRKPMTTLCTANGSTFLYDVSDDLFKIEANLTESKKTHKHNAKITADIQNGTLSPAAGRKKMRKFGTGVVNGRQTYGIYIKKSEFDDYTTMCLNSGSVSEINIGYETIRGKDRWYASLVLTDAIPPQFSAKAKLGKGKVGFVTSLEYGVAVSDDDYRVVNYGAYNNTKSAYRNRYDELDAKYTEKQNEFSKLSIINNPQRYDANGTGIKYNPSMPP